MPPVTPNGGRFGPSPRSYDLPRFTLSGPTRWPHDSDDVLIQTGDPAQFLDHADATQRARHTAHRPNGDRPACGTPLEDAAGAWHTMAAGHMAPVNALLCPKRNCFGEAP